MPFFSWFKSKPEQPDPVPEQSADNSEVSTAKPSDRPKRGPRRSKLRDTIPEEELIVSVLGGPGRSFSRPQRATVDVPLANILVGLTPELKADNRLSLAKRVQMPRRDLQISADGSTASATVAALYAACPDIFNTPIDPGDTQLVSFSLSEPPPEGRPLSKQSEQTRTELDEVATNQEPGQSKESPKPSAEPVSTSELTENEEKLAEDDAVSIAKTNGQHVSDIPARTLVSVPAAVIWQQLEHYTNGLGTDANAISDFQIPLDQIQPQLASGKVTVPAHLLVEQLPAETRTKFNSLDPQQPITLPLREIIPQLPPSAVQPRSDQEPEIASTMVTPFSQVARHDALRLHPDGREELMAEDEMQLELGGDFQLPSSTPSTQTPVEPETHAPEPSLEPGKTTDSEPAVLAMQPNASPVLEAERPETEPKTSEPETVANLSATPEDTRTAANYVVSGDLSGVSDILLWDEDRDLPGVIEHLGRLPGLESAVLYSPAGKILAGNLGDQIPEHVVTALLPPLFAVARQRLRDVRPTGLETLTFAWQRQQISLFWQENLCLAVRHANRPFKPGVREKLVSVLKELGAHVVVSET
ncbi:MAG: hypothetical protein JO308_02250 [Verrucomicrobia bacterium]|nr:hypothetical protein [Verrucomicrobiota bacterium]